MNDRAIEKFLLGVEPKYNASVAKLRRDEIGSEGVYAIAGFAAYVASCAPAAMRIHAGPLQSAVETTAQILDQQGLLPTAPEALGSRSLSDLIGDGTVQVAVDPKYAQALGISTITLRTSIYGNSFWEILQNDSDSPFFTSDYPIALEGRGGRRVHNWIIPLAPDIAIRVVPDVRLSRMPPDFSFSKFSYQRRQARVGEVREINRLIVQCAEDAVFFRDDREWVRDFIAKNRNYRIEALTDRIPAGGGTLQVSTQRIVRFLRRPEV